MQPISHDIRYKAAQTIYYAIGEQAERIGLPLNVWMTINLSMTSIKPQDAVKQFARWRNNHFVKWAKRPRKGLGEAFDPAFAYVFENATKTETFEVMGDDYPHNVNVHFYGHVPIERYYDFRRRAVEWMDYIAGEICPSGTVDVQRVKIDNGIRGYCLKGAAPAVAEHFGSQHSPQGIIVGKRTGVSENLGPLARTELDQILGVDRKSRMWKAKRKVY